MNTSVQLPSGRPRRWLWVCVAILAALLAAVGATSAALLQPTRRDVRIDTLIVNPADLGDDIIHDNEWRGFAANTNRGEAFREWSEKRGSLLHEESHKYSNTLIARYYSATLSPTRMYSHRYESRLVKTTPLPSGIGADSATLLCGHIGRSTPGTLDRCSIWGYWARYGQYVAYLEFTDAPLIQAQFTILAGRFDATITSRLR